MSLGAFTLPVARLPGPREGYDLSGVQTFGSGPYRVTLKSTIRARRPAGTGNGGVGSLGGGSGFPLPKPHKALIEGVSEQYRITSTSGTITTSFAGRPDPFCVPSSSDFAVHGLAGTVTSTIQLSLGRAHTQRASNGASSPNQAKVHTVQVEYRAQLNGSVMIRTHGDPSSCAPLGSCGANGTFALRVHSRPGKLLLFAFAGSRRPLRDELAALGLRKHGNPRGILIAGAFLVRGPTTYAVDVTQGANTCKDTGPTGPGLFLLDGAGGPVSATFSQGPPLLHLRCPGPMVSQDNGFASASVRLARLRHGGRIHLRTVRNLRDDGYTVRTSANVAVTLGRPKVTITTDALRSPNPG
ncbi:MAG TPA: hypothetical protein VFI54_13630 [Solirubrobacteraceae bacterium]|nr:hypothetical protein [Solirubrobacteraceae bacterium]